MIHFPCKDVVNLPLINSPFSLNKDDQDYNEIPNNNNNNNNNNNLNEPKSAMFEPFPSEDPTKIPEQTKELVRWFRKMGQTDQPMLVLDEEDLAPDAKEFLFPCAQDEYTLSDSLKPEDANDFLEGENKS